MTYSKLYQMPKRARGDPIEYVRNVRLRAFRQFWDWFRQLLHPRRLHYSWTRVWLSSQELETWMWTWNVGLERGVWRDPSVFSEYFMRNL